MLGARRGALALAVAIGFAVAVVVVSGPDRATGQTVIHVSVPTGSGGAIAEIEVSGGSGFQLGDGVVARGPLFDPATGADAGSFYMECTAMRKIVATTVGLWRCSYHLRLTDGGLVLQGLDPRGEGTSTFAVLGGTKTYRDASGDAVFTDSVNGTDIVVSLT
jgi:hypothetical protein